MWPFVVFYKELVPGQICFFVLFKDYFVEHFTRLAHSIITFLLPLKYNGSKAFIVASAISLLFTVFQMRT